MVRRRYIPLRTAQPGMILDQAIIDRAGRVLIARRTPLEDFHIEGLRKMGVGGIYIREGEEDPDQEEEKEEQSKKDSTDFYKVIEELKKKNKKDKPLSYGNNSGNSYILNNR